MPESSDQKDFKFNFLLKTIFETNLKLFSLYRKTKYLLVSLTALGYLRIEDDRGQGVVYGAEVKSIYFLNGARHSVYYKRNEGSAVLMVPLEKKLFSKKLRI